MLEVVARLGRAHPGLVHIDSAASAQENLVESAKAMLGLPERFQRVVLKMGCRVLAKIAAELEGLDSIHYSEAADSVDIVEHVVVIEANSELGMEQTEE